jgi:uncharacterized protein YdeI (YjbR/CyaY-like superfamily)
MEITETICVKNRKKWRKWLEKNSEKKNSIWIIYQRKNSNKKGIPYEEALEEALCFGWIDSIIKTLDKNSFVQRFTPRNPKSKFSQPNKERLKILLSQGKISNKEIKRVKEILKEKFNFPKDLLKEIRKNKKAWNNFKNFSESYKRIRIAYIDSARDNPEQFKIRLNNFLKKTEKNKLFGFRGFD